MTMMKMISMLSMKNSKATPCQPLHSTVQIFLTSVRHSSGNICVATCTLGIKTNIIHGNLLHELVLCMMNDTTNNPCLIYIPIGTANMIGLEPYKQLICANNAYLSSLATIPVLRLSDTTLNLCIKVQHPNKPKTLLTINEILLSNEWCVNIEPTQQEGKIFILTTKSDITDGQHENLPPIFTNHLMKNPNFQLDPDNPIACHDNQVQHNPALANYANALCQSIPRNHNKSDQPTSKFSQLPPICTPKLITISYKAATTQLLPKTLPVTNNAQLNNKCKHCNTKATARISLWTTP